MKLFETNNLSDIKIKTINGVEIYYLDNFYKNPQDICDFLLENEPPLWKSGEDGSKNLIYFEDRRHAIKTSEMAELSYSLGRIVGQKPENPNTIVTNFTRFLSHEFNDYSNNFWWPHRDSGYNAIIYLNKDIDYENSGTNIYNRLDNSFIYPEEHRNPWCSKKNWEVVASIPSIYNRMVMFNGKNFHAMNISDNTFFADKLEDAKFRMNQVIFFE